ncbi:unnamed protein product [Closterium sp. NIES-54]
MNALRFSLLALLAAALVLHLVPARTAASDVEAAIANDEFTFDDAADEVGDFLGDDLSEVVERRILAGTSGAATGSKGGAYKPKHKKRRNAAGDGSGYCPYAGKSGNSPAAEYCGGACCIVSCSKTEPLSAAARAALFLFVSFLRPSSPVPCSIHSPVCLSVPLSLLFLSSRAAVATRDAQRLTYLSACALSPTHACTRAPRRAPSTRAVVATSAARRAAAARRTALSCAARATNCAAPRARRYALRMHSTLPE